MEMYAASEARGGVLEPNGAAEIKFRQKDYVATAHRLDPTLRALDAKLKAMGALLRCVVFCVYIYMCVCVCVCWVRPAGPRSSCFCTLQPTT